jgi:hypothetical protein
MYLPKTKYIGGKFTNGEEWSLEGETTSYRGYYFEVSNSRSYTGRRPGDGANNLLVPFIGEPQTPSLQVNKTTYDRIRNNAEAFALKRTLPVPIYYPVPTRQDYQNSKFIRYLAKEKLTGKVCEITLDTYIALNNNDTRYYYPGYITTKLFWTIIGPLEDTLVDGVVLFGAASINAKSREIADKEVPGARKFLSNLAQFVI